MDVVKNNSQQPSTPAPLQTSGEDNAMHRQRGNRVLLVSSSILVFASIFTGVLFAYQKLQTKSTPSLEKLRTTNKPSQRKISTFQTIEIMSSNFNDSKTNMYFSDANKIYKKNFNGSNVEELATLPHNISSITMLPDGVLLMYTDNSTYEKVVNKQPGDTDYKQTIINYKYWALKPSSNELEQIDEQKYQMLIRLKDYSTSERIFTKELQNGQAEIVMDKHDGTQPTKIGVLTQKLVSLGCEFDPCPGKIHPSEFYPSFDGSYLLNKPLGGGGLGASGLVVSRDGRKVYKIDFYWYGSSAIWIDNDKLLTRAQDGTQKIVAFKPDGTFSEKQVFEDLGGYFEQETVSPSRKLVYITDATSIYDIEQNKIITAETFNEQQVRKQFNLLSEEIIENRYVFLGWNESSDKVLYAITTRAISGAHNNDRTIVREIRFFDVKTKKVYTLAKLNPNLTSTDEYLLEGKPRADSRHFAIR